MLEAAAAAEHRSRGLRTTYSYEDVPTPTVPVADPHELNIIRSPCLYSLCLANDKSKIGPGPNGGYSRVNGMYPEIMKQILQTEGLAPNLGEIILYPHIYSAVMASPRSGVKLARTLGNAFRRPHPLAIKWLTFLDLTDSIPAQICQLLDLRALETLKLTWPQGEQGVVFSETVRFPSLTTLLVDLSLCIGTAFPRGSAQVKHFISAHPQLKHLHVGRWDWSFASSVGEDHHGMNGVSKNGDLVLSKRATS